MNAAPSIVDDTETRNRIIAALSEKSSEKLWPSLERVTTKRSQVLSAAGSRVAHMYFVESGMISLVRPMQDGNGVEIGAVGYEGLVPPTGLLGVDRAVLDSVVQIPGSVLRVPCSVLERMLAADRELSALIHGYAAVFLGQLTLTAACNILHSIEERCCRWLLAAHDSVGSDTFGLTHEFLGMTLGVRRASVSVTADKLRRAGLIDYSHGNITIINRPALERAVCECYETVRQEFDALFAESTPHK